MRKRFLIAAAFCVPASMSAADIRDLEALRRACADRRVEVEGYVAGWVDKLQDDQFVAYQTVKRQTDPASKVPAMEIFLDVSANACVPATTSVTEIVDHVCKRINEEHDFEGDRTSGFMAFALGEKYPCQK